MARTYSDGMDACFQSAMDKAMSALCKMIRAREHVSFDENGQCASPKCQDTFNAAWIAEQGAHTFGREMFGEFWPDIVDRATDFAHATCAHGVSIFRDDCFECQQEAEAEAELVIESA